MSIPLVQKPEKDDINTSIIAIKRNIERINMLLGLSNSEEIDTSEFVKKSDIVDVVEAGNMNPVTSNAVVPVDEVTLGNMHSVTSNAVAKCFKFEVNVEVDTGMTWNGNKIYRKVIDHSFVTNGSYTWLVSSEVASGNYQAVDLGMSYMYGAYGTRQPWFTTAYGNSIFYMDAGVVYFRSPHPDGRVSLVCYYCKTNN